MAVHLLIVVQLVAWVGYMVLAYLGPENRQPDQSLESYLFLCSLGVILCFVPALRLARRFHMQPYAFVLACLPIIVVATVFLVSVV